MSERNPGVPFDPSWLESMEVDEGAIQAQAAAIETREPDDERAMLLDAVRCLDLTSLNGNEPKAEIRDLAARALEPLGPGHDVQVAALCVFPTYVPTALQVLEGSPVKVATVAGHFPSGEATIAEKVAEIREAVETGAHEIDVVIDRRLPLEGDWKSLHHEVSAFREACGPTTLKTIIASGSLPDLRTIANTSLVCLMAGSDFVKTSTGKEPINATLPAGIAIAQAVERYRFRSYHRAGMKASGGIRSARHAMEWVALAREELGHADPATFRIGASAVLGEIEMRLMLLAEG